jgi:APA family basic amino acid/polyamine antiporter
MSSALHRRFGIWAAMAMIVAEVMGVGLFLTPAGMARTIGATWWVLGVWTVVGLLSVAGALCFAELGSRFPEAGGSYVFLREAFGERCAFVYGWMALLVMDPGLAAALGVGLARYVLVVMKGPATLVPVVAIGCIVILGGVSVLGIQTSARLLRWTTIAKVGAIALLVVAVLARNGEGASAGAGPVTGPSGIPSIGILAGSLMGAFFAIAGWWDLGKMSEEIVEPQRTLPVALVGGILIVTVIYAQLSVAFMHALQGQALPTDEAFVSALGTTLFGANSATILGAVIVVAVAGSLSAVLLGAPRVYLAMARSGVFPAALVRFHPTRQSAPRATLIQVALACLLVTLGTFDQILGYFVPVVVLFLGLSAAAILVLPRPQADAAVFRNPWHPLPIAMFLVLVVVMIVLFALGRPMQTLIGAAVVALGIPVSWFVVKRPHRTDAISTTPALAVPLSPPAPWTKS